MRNLPMGGGLAVARTAYRVPCGHLSLGIALVVLFGCRDEVPSRLAMLAGA